MAPVAEEGGPRRPHQALGGPEAIPAATPAGQSLDPGRAPASRQRKLGMEERVIRDHLGQEVGCMDAVGQSQSSLEKEEEQEDPTRPEERAEGQSQPGPLDDISGPNAAPGEGPLDCELGCRDAPEGESPTSENHGSAPGTPQNENGSPKGQGGRLPEGGLLDKEAGGGGVGQEAVPEQSASEVEPTLAPAPGKASATESAEQSQGSPAKTPEGQESVATEEWQGGPQRPGSPLEPLTEPLPPQFPPAQGREALSSQEGPKIPPLDLVRPDSPPAQIPAVPEETVPSLQGTEESTLLDQKIPLQEKGGSLLDPEPPFLSNQGPSPALGQNSSLFNQAPPAGQECLPGENLPPLQPDPPSSPLGTKPPSAQGEPPLLLDVMDQVTTTSLHEAEGALSSQSQTPSLLDPPLSPRPEEEPLLPQHVPSPGHEMEKPALQQGPPGCELEGSLPGMVQTSTDPLSSLLPDQMVPLLDAKTSALEESPVALQGQPPGPPQLQLSPFPEADVFHPSQVPPSVEDPGETPGAPLDLQDTEPRSPTGKTPASSLQEAGGALPGESLAPLPGPTSPQLPRGSSPHLAPPAPEDQTSLLGQPTPSQEAAESLPEGQSSAEPAEESAADRAEQAASPGQAQSPLLQQGAPACPHAGPSPSQETLRPLPEHSKAVGRGNASVASAGGGEAREVLGKLPAEKPPLLKEEAEAARDSSAGDPQSKGGLVKPPGVATSTPGPHNSSTRSSANTAYAHQPQAARSHPGPGQGAEKAKHKSCQCCTLM